MGVAWHLLGLPAVRLPPELALFAFLPPLLTTAAYRLPLAAVRANLLPIGLLAIGLVLASMLAVAVVGHAFGGLPWAMAFVLGAIVAPPDPVTATAVGGRTGIAHRLTVILEGEGLINDAVAIVAYGVAVDWALRGRFEWADAVRAVLQEAPIGVVVGLAIGGLAHRLRGHVSSVPLEVGISLLTPFLAYHVAERVHGSGVLALVTLGFLLRRQAARIVDPSVWLGTRMVWGALEYVTTLLLFVLLGIVAGEVLAGGIGRAELGLALAVLVAVAAVRMAWMFVVPPLLYRLRPAQPTATARERAVVGWAGMRGVVSLALALALPTLATADGDARTPIVAATLVVIVGTLFGQGGSLPWLIRRLGAGDPDRDTNDLRRVRRDALREARAVLDHAGHGAASGGRIAPGAGLGIAPPRGDDGGRRRALHAALRAQRETVRRQWASGELSGELADRLETEIAIAAINLDNPDDEGGLSTRM